MLKPKQKFYQLTPLQQQAHQISSIYKMINDQERNMQDLLEKYKSTNQEEPPQAQITYRQQSKTLQAKRDTRLSSSLKKDKSFTSSDIVELPSISPNRKPEKKKKSHRSPNLIQNPYFSEAKGQVDIKKLKDGLKRAYLTEKLQKLGKVETRSTTQQIKKEQIKRLNYSKVNSPEKQQKPLIVKDEVKNKNNENDIPKPLGYFKQIEVNDDSSSDEGDVPLSFYQKEFKGIIRSQCLQETNFLYFSKNQSMKDWTETLLLLFEKHDKQLAVLKKRCKYLQKFDSNFFSIDIFRND